MRKLMLSVAMTAGVTMVLAAAATEAKANPMVQGLSNQVNTLERINERRPRGEVYQAIAGSIEMVRARLRLVYSGRLPLQAVLGEMPEMLRSIETYSYNGSDQAPWQHAQTAAAINRLRQEVREAELALGGGYGRGGGWGQGGYGHGRGGYAPTPVYAPAPARVYAPAPVYRQTPPVYVPPPAPARFRY